jgi:hypothetical protein
VPPPLAGRSFNSPAITIYELHRPDGGDRRGGVREATPLGTMAFHAGRVPRGLHEAAARPDGGARRTQASRRDADDRPGVALRSSSLSDLADLTHRV